MYTISYLHIANEQNVWCLQRHTVLQARAGSRKPACADEKFKNWCPGELLSARQEPIHCMCWTQSCFSSSSMTKNFSRENWLQQNSARVHQPHVCKHVLLTSFVIFGSEITELC